MYKQTDKKLQGSSFDLRNMKGFEQTLTANVPTC